MPSFIAREPIYLLPDGTTSTEPAEGARRIAGRGQILTEPAQRRYGLANPDLAAAQPAEEAGAETTDAAKTDEAPPETPPADPPKRTPRARSRR